MNIIDILLTVYLGTVLMHADRYSAKRCCLMQYPWHDAFLLPHQYCPLIHQYWFMLSYRASCT